VPSSKLMARGSRTPNHDVRYRSITIGNLDKVQQTVNKYGTTRVVGSCDFWNGKENQRNDQKYSSLHLHGRILMHSLGGGSSDATDRPGCIA
jgi:hypothetical protein